VRRWSATFSVRKAAAAMSEVGSAAANAVADNSCRSCSRCANFTTYRGRRASVPNARDRETRHPSTSIVKGPASIARSRRRSTTSCTPELSRCAAVERPRRPNHHAALQGAVAPITTEAFPTAGPQTAAMRRAPHPSPPSCLTARDRPGWENQRSQIAKTSDRLSL
jgi:hypothetical protein